MKKAKFYQPTSYTIDKAVAKRAELLYESEGRVAILTDSITTSHLIDRALWTYSYMSFLPHALDTDPYLDDQLILISTNAYSFNINWPLICVNTPIRHYAHDYACVIFSIGCSYITDIRKQFKSLQADGVEVEFSKG
ncbi:DNA polymerase III subunit chi [Candidatus Sneabacter namystus]|uniref:DNA polymerase III subunit chi n=1 Tax=Candidatus Sneabacter namystus TaxID=2601646 RepID=A0A5C0UIV3_9RICK|nr:DNA polymerase III subunit chi [Candidatus Sneabacter namystus]QEK39717.1 hypothetical protein FZC37_02125 [Candidatus Sneabacter namystus]